ncbi:MAG: outer membrane protein assembly factor BamA [Planctomycetota bacterium]|jgi:outer membrane protein insertion porin family
MSVLVVLISAVAAFAQEAINVEKIVFEGNSRYSEATLKYSMRTKEGKPLDAELLARDVSMLRDFFETITYEEEFGPGGITLRFKVSENPLVAQVIFLGLNQKAEQELRPYIQTRTGYPLASFRLENDVRIIEKIYRDAGFHFVEVRSEVLDVEGAKRVVFRIVEGPEVCVDEVLFQGGDSVPSGEVLDLLSMSESGFLSPSLFVERQLEQDRVTISRRYRDEGFLDVKVRLRDVTFDAPREYATITWDIAEGAPWTIREVQVTGGGSIPDRESVVSIAQDLVPGSQWNRPRIERTVDKMIDAARSQGFTDIRIDTEPVPHADGREQTLRLVITEGRRITLRSLDVSGNVITRDKVILREFTVAPGDPLDTSAIRKSIRRVFGTQYFASVVPVIRDTDEPDRRDVEIQVEENPRTSQFRIGFGVSSDEGVFGSFELTLRNFDISDVPSRWSDVGAGRAFKGGGQTLSLSLQPGSDVSNYRIAFTEPWIWDKPILFGVDVFLRESQLFRYDQDRTGVILNLQRRWLISRKGLDDLYTVGLRPRIERVEISDLDRDAPPNAFDIEGTNDVQALALEFAWRRVDQELSTEEGWKMSYTPEIAGFGGDFEFYRNTVEAIRVFTLARDEDDRAHTLKLRSGLGFAGPLGDDAVPLTERYFAGGGSGIGSIRGFEFGGVGPHGRGDRSKSPAKVARSIENNHGDPMGGEALATASMEYGFPLFSEIIRGNLFVDAGNLAENTGGLTSDWRSSAGFGISIKIPLLGQVPLRFDFGFPLAKEKGDDRQVLSFEFSQFF